MDLSEIFKNIDQCDVVSFDIFDTLLLRPYVEPNDLFRHLGALYKIDNFKNIRWWAFEDARNSYCINGVEDVSFEQIYKFMPQEYQFIKEKELELEKQILQPNYEIKEVWDYAKKLGKKIIVISDMYLSKEFLQEVLEQKGFVPDKIFVSSDFKKLKASGNLYKTVIEELKIPPSKIFHIGDNISSDVSKAIENGIVAYHYPKVIDRYFNQNSKAKLFYKKNKGILSASIIVGVLSIIIHRCKLLNSNLNEDEYWYKLGIEYAGVVAYFFMDWLNKKLIKENIQEALFIARDGYSLKKVLEIINSKIKAHYVYAPRMIALVSTLDLGKHFEFSSPKGIESVKSIIKYYNEKFPNKFQFKSDNIFTLKQAYEFIRDNKYLLQDLAKKEISHYIKYLKTVGIDNKSLAIVDSSTLFFTAQEFLEKCMPDNKFIGYYLFVSNLYYSHFKNKFKFKCMFNHSLNTAFIEFLLTSPEYPVIGVTEEGTPIYMKDYNIAEMIRKDIYKKIYNGIIDFSVLIKDIFNDYNIPENYEFLEDWVFKFCNCPSKVDKKYFSKITYTFESNHSNYQQIFPNWYKGHSKKLSLLERIFSITNEGKHKVVTLAGMKVKFKRQKYAG